MYVTYSNLFKLLIDKGLNKTEFAREVGISSNTLAKLSKNELVSLEVLVRICRKLDCSLGDIVQIEFGGSSLTIRVKELRESIRKEEAETLYEVIAQ